MVAKKEKPRTKLSALSVGELNNSYKMPDEPGQPGEVLVMNQHGNAEWREHRTGTAQRRKLFGNIVIPNHTDTILVRHTGFEDSSYFIFVTLKNTSDAHNVPSCLITGQDEKAFEITFSGPVKGDGYILNWLALQ